MLNAQLKRIAIAFMIASPASQTATAGVTSQYTSIAAEKCKQVFSDEESGSVGFTCPGYAGNDVWVAEGDLRLFLGYGQNPRSQCVASQTFGAFNTAGPTLEWRLRDGVPFATIIRYKLDDGQGNTQSFLTVTALSGDEACHVAYVDGALKDHNQIARDIADERAATFNCTSDMPVVLSKRAIEPSHLVSGVPCTGDAPMKFQQQQ